MHPLRRGKGGCGLAGFSGGIARTDNLDPASRRVDFAIDGRVLTDELRLPEIASGASRIAAEGAVRDFVLEIEHTIAAGGWVVMEGRDIGSAVFPDAGYKFYLFASPLERARRRLAQAHEVPDGATLESVAAEIARRDEADSSRAIAPLRAAPDAVMVDTSDMDIETAVRYVIERIGEDVVA